MFLPQACVDYSIAHEGHYRHLMTVSHTTISEGSTSYIP